LAPFGISYYLKGQLKQFKKQGLISVYKVTTKRLGKWHYRVKVDVDLTSTQIIRVLDQLSKRLRGSGR
jgi:hypothetical protein